MRGTAVWEQTEVRSKKPAPAGVRIRFKSGLPPTPQYPMAVVTLAKGSEGGTSCYTSHGMGPSGEGLEA